MKPTVAQQRIIDRLKSTRDVLSNSLPGGFYRWRAPNGKRIDGERAVSINTIVSMKRKGLIRTVEIIASTGSSFSKCIVRLAALLLIATSCFAGPREQLYVAEAEAKVQSESRKVMPNDFDKNSPRAPGVVAGAVKPFRAIMWSPSWCTVCIRNNWLLEEGDSRVKYEYRHGDELAFPPEVQNYANSAFPFGTSLAGQQRGWPVWQIELADGSWTWAYHARSFDDLVAIHKLKIGQQIPDSTYGKAVQDRQGRDLGRDSQAPPKVRPAEKTKQPIAARGRRQQAPPAGAGIAFHCRPQVEQAFAFIRKNIGENVPITLEIDRTGEGKFPLLKAGTDYSLLAVLGRSGRVELSAEKSDLLLVKSIGFGYRVDGDDVLIDADPIRFEGLAERLSPKPSAYGTDAVGIEPMTLMTIFSVADAIWKILHPSCDLELGGNITLEAVLVGDVLTTKFSQCPKLRITAYWQWLLGVDQVVVSIDPTVKSTIEFSNEPGIMFPIKRRYFSVE